MRRLLILLSALAIAGVFVPATAADPASGTLSDPSATVAWTGTHWRTDDAPIPDQFDLTIDLPAGYWDANDGGVEVAIRWVSEYNVFDLYVLDAGGATVASSTGFPTSAHSLIMREPANGLYHVVVVPAGVQVDEERPYEGIAQVELDTTRTGPLVPDLVALPPAEFKIAAGTLSFMPVEYQETGGCYPDEMAENPSLTRCLRFDAGVANLGHGPFELRLDTTTMAGEPVVWQDIYAADGSRTTIGAGTYTWHATHAHVHYQNFVEYRLHRVGEDGTPGEEVVGSRKADFCMIDTRLIWFGEYGNGPRNHHFPQCNIPGGDGAGPTEMRQGIDVGWADIYTWDLPGQYIDISNVPDGIYAVVLEADPSGVLSQLTRTNDISWTRIRIAGLSVTECTAPPPGC
ncbi:MAG TPA: lysyl oxidase family protein [Actinomycetota bacterium]|nr:lysyl oxidase family protein [Actinomycetota bacterium]